MPVIRTPDERFENLPGYNFKPNYVQINDARVHYVDEGEGEVVLCLHGEPSWSYLYRKMIPSLQKPQVIAPDFIGSDARINIPNLMNTPIKCIATTIINLIEKLDLKNITIVVQDWGGLMGLRVVSLIPERFARLVIMNTGLPTGEGPLPAALLIGVITLKGRRNCQLEILCRGGFWN